MAGLGIEICEPLSDKKAKEVLGDAPAEVCAVATNQPIKYGRKDCGGYKTPPLSYVNVSYTIVEDGFVSYTLDMWVGVQDNNFGQDCVWVGLDAGEAGKACFTTQDCYFEAFSYAAALYLAKQVNQWEINNQPVDSVAYKVNSDSGAKWVAIAATMAVLVRVAASIAVGGTVSIISAYSTGLIGALDDLNEELGLRVTSEERVV